jgi:hypothetical protein
MVDLSVNIHGDIYYEKYLNRSIFAKDTDTLHMARFLKLTHLVVNTAHITRITHHVSATDTSYKIYMNELNVGGWFFAGSGALGNKDEVILVDSKQNPNDYSAIRGWIAKTDDRDFV